MNNTKYRRLNPWYSHLEHARTRCNNKNSNMYKHYGARGIKCLLTKDDIIFLWKRDRADLLKMPSIDRIDSDGNYVLDNCRFIEHSDNAKRSVENKKKMIVQESLDGQIIKTYGSVADANRAFGRHPDCSSIFMCLSGARKTTYNYRWSYADGKK